VTAAAEDIRVSGALPGDDEVRSARSVLPPLSPEQEFACFARALYREGYNDHKAGHITIRKSADEYYVNPFELPWDEITASDVMTMDGDGRILAGRWTITPAVRLHLELHQLRPGLNVTVHSHSEYGTLWAIAGEVPPAFEQMGALAIGDEIAVYDQFDGDVATTDEARAVASSMADGASMALLANHGVLVVGQDVRSTFLRAMALELRCKYAWRMAAIGKGRQMPKSGEQALIDHVWGRVGFYPHLWEAMARREIRLDPTVLD
jgi:ribulose-5-phosphate 4-epimerase/fuculose-1-phosphate aldolase